MTCACGREPDPGICPNDDETGSAGGHCRCAHPVRRPLPCMVCGKELALLGEWKDSFRQPLHAAEFISHGHYGSAWDPASSVHMTLNICDDCLAANRLRVLIVREKQPREIEYEYTEYVPAAGRTSSNSSTTNEGAAQ